MKAGIYSATAGQKEYGYLDAMVAAGDARFLGSGYDAQGRKMIAVEVLARGKKVRRNPKRMGAITIGRGFCSGATRAYDDWREKWWREAIQNSVDAGAKNIKCVVEPVPRQEQWIVSCEDDGRGMDETTILEKFLVLGETTKLEGECTGGFGKAKELLLLPWIRWTVASGNVVVSGQGGLYEIEEVAKFRKGVLIEVVMPEDEHTYDSSAEAFIQKCYLPSVRFTVNGKRVEAALRKGKQIRSFNGKADLHYSKKESFHQHLLIRSNGLYMFYEYISDSVPGTAIIELRGKSVDLLTDNRDGFRDALLRSQVSKFVRGLATDAKQELRSKKGLIRKRFKGSGKFTSASEERLTAAMMEALGTMVPRGETSSGKVVLSGSQQNAVVQVVRTMGGAEQSERDIPEWHEASISPQPAPPINLRMTVELVKAMLDGMEVRGTTHMEAIAKQVAWEPDFYLYNNIEGWHVPKRFYPEKMAPGIRKLLRFWAELCRFMLIQLGSENEYGVGFVFETDTGGMHVVEENESWLLLNPHKDTWDHGGPIYSLGDKDDIDTIFGIALHEVTHMADGISYHGDSYASALTRNLGKLRGVTRQVERIRKAIVSRGPAASPRLRHAQSAEDAIHILAGERRPMTVDELNEELPTRMTFENMAAMEAKRFVEGRWDDEIAAKRYSETDKGWKWALDRAKARERKYAKRRTA